MNINLKDRLLDHVFECDHQSYDFDENYKIFFLRSKRQ